MRICNILFKGKIMIKNETLKKILPSSVLLNPIGKNGNEIWIEDFEQLYPIFFKSVLEIQKQIFLSFLDLVNLQKMENLNIQLSKLF